MALPICIITPTGMICEGSSYEHHVHLAKAGGGGQGCHKSQEQIPADIAGRVGKLIQLANLQDDTPFVIMTKP